MTKLNQLGLLLRELTDRLDVKLVSMASQNIGLDSNVLLERLSFFVMRGQPLARLRLGNLFV